MKLHIVFIFLVTLYATITSVMSIAHHQYTSTSVDNRELGVLFYSNRDGRMGIFWMHSDGSGIERVFSYGTQNRYATLSPDGRKLIVASTTPDSSDPRYILIDRETREFTPLSFENVWWVDFAWSPDSTKVAYAAADFGGEIHILDLFTGDKWLVTNLNFLDWSSGYSTTRIEWSSDGKKLALGYETARHGVPNLVTLTVNADGSDLRILAPNIAGLPVWDVHANDLIYYACVGQEYRLSAICYSDLPRSLHVQIANFANCLPEQRMETLDVSPKGQILFDCISYFVESSDIYLFDPATGETINLTGGNHGNNTQAQWFYRPTIFNNENTNS